VVGLPACRRALLRRPIRRLAERLAPACFSALLHTVDAGPTGCPGSPVHDLRAGRFSARAIRRVRGRLRGPGSRQGNRRHRAARSRRLAGRRETPAGRRLVRFACARDDAVDRLPGGPHRSLGGKSGVRRLQRSIPPAARSPRGVSPPPSLLPGRRQRTLDRHGRDCFLVETDASLPRGRLAAGMAPRLRSYRFAGVFWGRRPGALPASRDAGDLCGNIRRNPKPARTRPGCRRHRLGFGSGHGELDQSPVSVSVRGQSGARRFRRAAESSRRLYRTNLPGRPRHHGLASHPGTGPSRTGLRVPSSPDHRSAGFHERVVGARRLGRSSGVYCLFQDLGSRVQPDALRVRARGLAAALWRARSSACRGGRLRPLPSRRAFPAPRPVGGRVYQSRADETLRKISLAGPYAARRRIARISRSMPRSQSGNKSTYCSSRWIERGTRHASSRTGTTKISSSGIRRAQSSA